MNEITLPRTGNSPLRFRGESIAEANSYYDRGPAEARWFKMSVYRAAGGQYVLAIGYRSRWQGELDQDSAEVLANAAAVRFALLDYDPCNPALWRGQRLHGPEGSASNLEAERRNDFNRNAIATAFKAAVSELLDSREFAEDLDEADEEGVACAIPWRLALDLASQHTLCSLRDDLDAAERLAGEPLTGADDAIRDYARRRLAALREEMR